MKHRRVEPEILDTLDPRHPDAIRSRRDLRTINAIMGNSRWFARQWKRLELGPSTLLELGAGDGRLAGHLQQRFNLPESGVCALDLAPAPPDWPEARPWLQEDLMHSELPEHDALLANLFLHHFDEETLRILGPKLRSKAKVLLFCEPERRTLHLRQGQLLQILACFNRVTRHDLAVSIRAGFRERELVSALGLSAAEWETTVETNVFGAHRVMAVRKNQASGKAH